jgi:hypothetical protein
MMVGHNEVDLMAVSRTGWAYEWEIKCSLPDWKNDLKKGRHDLGERSKGVSFFNYCVVESILMEDLSWVPDYAGIYTIGDDARHVRKIRSPKKLGTGILWDKQEIWRLCYYRYWGLRDKYRRALVEMKKKPGYRRNEPLHGLMMEISERQKAPMGILLPHNWMGKSSPLEKTTRKVVLRK